MPAREPLKSFEYVLDPCSSLPRRSPYLVSDNGISDIWAYDLKTQSQVEVASNDLSSLLHQLPCVSLDPLRFNHVILNYCRIFSAYLACAMIWHEDVSFLFCNCYVFFIFYRRQPCMGQVPVGFALTFCVMNCTRLLLNIRLACLKHTEVYSRPIAIEVDICHSPDIQT